MNTATDTNIKNMMLSLGDDQVKTAASLLKRGYTVCREIDG